MTYAHTKMFLKSTKTWWWPELRFECKPSIMDVPHSFLSIHQPIQLSNYPSIYLNTVYPITIAQTITYIYIIRWGKENRRPWPAFIYSECGENSMVNLKLHLEWGENSLVNLKLHFELGVNSLVNIKLLLEWGVNSSVILKLHIKWGVNSLVNLKLLLEWGVNSLVNLKLHLEWGVNSLVNLKLHLKTITILISRALL